jgi:hypothetical protein
MCCEGSCHQRAPILGHDAAPSPGGHRATPRRPADESLRRHLSLAHMEGGSGRSEASPTAILQDTHSVEGEFSEV